MNKKEHWEKINEEDRLLTIENPELNQSGIYDNEGNKLPKEKRESFISMPTEFILSRVYYKLTNKDKSIYTFLASKCSFRRNTRIKTDTINELTGIPIVTIKRSLRRLEFYHFIHRRVYSLGPRSKRRIITLQRWDSAYKLLVKEGKIKVVPGKGIMSITPYLPNKFKKDLK